MIAWNCQNSWEKFRISSRVEITMAANMSGQPSLQTTSPLLWFHEPPTKNDLNDQSDDDFDG